MGNRDVFNGFKAGFVLGLAFLWAAQAHYINAIAHVLVGGLLTGIAIVVAAKARRARKLETISADYDGGSVELGFSGPRRVAFVISDDNNAMSWAMATKPPHKDDGSGYLDDKTTADDVLQRAMRS